MRRVLRRAVAGDGRAASLSQYGYFKLDEHELFATCTKMHVSLRKHFLRNVQFNFATFTKFLRARSRPYRRPFLALYQIQDESTRKYTYFYLDMCTQSDVRVKLLISRFYVLHPARSLYCRENPWTRGEPRRLCLLFNVYHLG